MLMSWFLLIAFYGNKDIAKRFPGSCSIKHVCLSQEYHYSDIIMGVMASQITSLTIVYSAVYSGANQRKPQSSTSLAFVRGIHQWLVKSLHKWPVMQKMFPFDDAIMCCTIFPRCALMGWRRSATLAQLQPCYCPIASAATLNDIGK